MAVIETASEQQFITSHIAKVNRKYQMSWKHSMKSCVTLHRRKETKYSIESTHNNSRRVRVLQENHMPHIAVCLILGCYKSYVDLLFDAHM